MCQVCWQSGRLSSSRSAMSTPAGMQLVSGVPVGVGLGGVGDGQVKQQGEAGLASGRFAD